ncbi:MAG: hypothetical protein K9N51_02490, partial [Candidatus Pacebacteria bacterium]|nr:hypothetical protein [Candidatus Paceibacterota bacterium]
MAYSPTLNPQVVTPTPIQSFGGMRGTDDSVITKFNSDGDNISDQYANEVIDFDCDVAGQLHVRPGCVKIGAGSLSDINAIFQVNLGGITQYAVFYGENLDLIDIPYEDFPEPFYEDPTTEEPRSDTLPSDWPTSTAGNPNQVQNDVPTEDASCTNTHTHSMT